MRREILCVAIAVFSAGCSASDARAPKAQAPKTALPAKKPAHAPVPPGHIARQELERVLAEGPPWILRRVLREEVIGQNGKFTGWRLTGLPEEWGPIDLRPGDVVTRVNNRSLETPDEAWEAWKSLGRARELRVMYQRQGTMRELVMPIDGEPSGAVVRALESDTPPPRPAPRGKSKGVTSLGADPAPGEDAGEYESY